MITAPELVSAAGTHWWPWLVAGVGILLVLLALRWLFVHIPKVRAKGLRLSAGDTGSISVDLGDVANAAAEVLGDATVAARTSLHVDRRSRRDHVQ